jgi:biopolymer transport protein ExbD
MSSIRMNAAQSQNYLGATLVLALVISLSLGFGHAQQLRQGISVQMARTTYAVGYPAADNADAWIVAVTAEGELYFGVKPVTPDQLAEEMKITPRQREAKLYIKADERAPFSVVRKVFAAAHEVGFESTVLLTSQTPSTAPGVVVTPEGLEVLIGQHSSKATLVVQVSPGQPSPTLQVNDQEIPAAALPEMLKRLLQNRNETPVLVKTSGPVSFAPVVHVIDTCHSIGAKVMLVPPLL